MGLWNVTLTGENSGSYVTRHSWLPSMHDNLVLHKPHHDALKAGSILVISTLAASLRRTLIHETSK